MTTMEIHDISIDGDESLNLIGNTVDGDVIINVVRGLRASARFLSAEHVSYYEAVYVPAVNHAAIVDAVRADRAVQLTGPTGAGLVTTAIAVLREVSPALPIQWFSVDEHEVEEGAAPLRPHGYLLRARDEDPWKLRSFLDAVRTSGGFAVVVGATEQDVLETVLARFTVVPAPAEEVYRSHLVQLGHGFTSWSYWERGIEFLKDAQPVDGKRLATLVDKAIRGGGTELDVERAYLGWATELRTWFHDHDDHLLDQALMIAAAAIAPADETQIYGAALSLARRLELNPAGGGLAWTPTTQLTDLLETRREDDGLVTFPRLGYASSVLRYVCQEYPLARLELLTWITDLITDPVAAVPPALGQRLAEEFTELAAEYDKYENILQTAQAWAAGDRTDLAFIVLGDACVDARIGGRVRRRLYEWATAARTPQTLKLVIVRVCQVLGQTLPSVALTRLKHLATYGNPQVRNEVVETVAALAEQDPSLVLATALEWARSAEKLSPGAAGRRLDVAMRVILGLLPSFGARERLLTVEIVSTLVIRGNPKLHPSLVSWAAALALLAPGRVTSIALNFAATGGPDPARTTLTKRFGATLFLDLLAIQDTDGQPIVLDTVYTVDPDKLACPWRIALTSPADFPDLSAELDLWLDTAVARPDLRPDLVTALVTAVRPYPLLRTSLTASVRQWAYDSRPRRPVRDALLTRILFPEWHRWALLLWVRLRTGLLGP